MSKNVIDVEISRNVNGGLSLCVCNKSGGERISGAKVGGCEPLKIFTVNADELIKAIRVNSYHSGE